MRTASPAATVLIMLASEIMAAERWRACQCEPDNVRFSFTNGFAVLERRSTVRGPSHLIDSWVAFDAPHA
jgi:hypothetical protein